MQYKDKTQDNKRVKKNVRIKTAGPTEKMHYAMHVNQSCVLLTSSLSFIFVQKHRYSRLVQIMLYFQEFKYRFFLAIFFCVFCRNHLIIINQLIDKLTRRH